MALATRCPHCGTAFKLVRDQLLLSGGWVRCGRCGEAFDGAALQFDTDRLPARAPRADAPPAPPVEAAHPLPVVAPEVHPQPQPEEQPPVDSWSEPWPEPAPEPAADPAWAADPHHDPHHDPRIEPALEPFWEAAVEPHAEPTPLEAPPPAPPPRPETPRPEAPEVDDEAPAAEPQFLRDARRHERWSRPGVRVALGAATVLLLALGMAQAAWAWRDTIGANWPLARPALQALCAAAGCTVHPPRQPQALAIEHVAIAPGADGRLRFDATLRNRSGSIVAYPDLELTLKGPDDAIVARKVIEPAQYLGLTDPAELARHLQLGIAARDELPVRFDLRLSEGQAAGYALYAFYP